MWQDACYFVVGGGVGDVDVLAPVGAYGNVDGGDSYGVEYAVDDFQ